MNVGTCSLCVKWIQPRLRSTSASSMAVKEPRKACGVLGRCSL